MIKTIVDHFDTIALFDKISGKIVFQNKELSQIFKKDIAHIDEVDNYLSEVCHLNFIPIFDSITIENKTYILRRKLIDKYIMLHFENNQYLTNILQVMKDESSIDDLTSCYNKKETELIFKRMLSTYLRYKSTFFTVLMFDIDHFKNVNDRYGHLAGDFILKELSSIVKNHLRDSDIFGRVGGEEFTILLSQTKLNGALKLANKIKDFIENYNFIYQDINIKITISIGLTSIVKTDSYFSIVDRVDKALYQAKNNGRNRIEYL